MEKFKIDCCHCAFEEFRKGEGLFCNHFQEKINFEQTKRIEEKGKRAFRGNDDCQGFILLEYMSDVFEAKNDGRKWTGSSCPIELRE